PPFKLLLQERRIFQGDQQLPTMWAAQATVAIIHQTVDSLTLPTFHKDSLPGMSRAFGHFYRHGALLSISHPALHNSQPHFSIEQVLGHTCSLARQCAPGMAKDLQSDHAGIPGQAACVPYIPLVMISSMCTALPREWREHRTDPQWRGDLAR